MNSPVSVRQLASRPSIFKEQSGLRIEDEPLRVEELKARTGRASERARACGTEGFI